jgi:hypothetical protein
VTDTDIARTESFIGIYLAANASDYRDRCQLPTGPEMGRELGVMGLLAAHRLADEPALAAGVIKERLLAGRWQSGDRGYEVFADDALLTLLDTLGVVGLKTRLGIGARQAEDGLLRNSAGGLPLSGADEQWQEFAVSLFEVEPAAVELAWRLGGDPAVLEALEANVDDMVTYRSTMEWVPGHVIMRKVRLLGGPDGVDEDVLVRWSEARRCRPLRWGALLALAQRGDRAVWEKLGAVVAERFPVRDDDLIAEPGVVAGAGDPEEFEFVLEYAALDDPAGWSAIEGLIADTDPDLLAPRVAAIIAIGENWAASDCPQADLREAIAQTCRDEGSGWLRSLMLEFLAAHPAEWT